MGFHYQNNDLAIAGGAANIQGGQFTVSDLRISSGQDPSHRNNAGDVHPLNFNAPTPSLSFVVGRHKTDPVADFWNQYVQPQGTTANDSPSALNFAFTGALLLRLANLPITVTINNMAIGQGSFTDYNMAADGRMVTINNWWVGGQACTSEANSTAKCFGLDENNNIWYLHFYRPEKDVTSNANTLFVTHVSNMAA